MSQFAAPLFPSTHTSSIFSQICCWSSSHSSEPGGPSSSQLVHTPCSGSTGTGTQIQGLKDPGSILCLPGLSAGEDGGAPLPWGCTPLPLAAGPLPWCTEPVASQSCSFWSFSVLVRKEFLPTPSLFHCSSRPPLVMFWPAIGWSVEACV